MAKLLPEFGGIVLDTDDVAHRLEGPGGEAVPEIVRSFGKVVLSEDGSIDRRKLGPIVFSDSDALARLDSIIHPLVVREVSDWLQRPCEARFKAVIVPLLFECGFDTAFKWDAILAVVCGEGEQLRRLRGRGLDDSASRKRIASQLPCEWKARRADRVIRNDSDLKALRKEVEKTLEALLV